MIRRDEVRRELAPTTHAAEYERLARLLAEVWRMTPGREPAETVREVEEFLAEWLPRG